MGLDRVPGPVNVIRIADPGRGGNLLRLQQHVRCTIVALPQQAEPAHVRDPKRPEPTLPRLASAT